MVYQGKYNRNKTAVIYHHDENDDDVVSSIKNVIQPKYPKAFYPSFSGSLLNFVYYNISRKVDLHILYIN